MESPIAAHAVIGDGRTTALIDDRGNVDWLCWPRPDSPSIFGGILDPRRGGSWRIGPSCEARVERRYIPETNVLQTRFRTTGGTLLVTDLMPIYSRNDSRAHLSPEHELLRLVTCEEGSVPVEIDLAPRVDYGTVTVEWRRIRPQELRADVCGGRLVLRATLDLQLGTDGVARARTVLTAGETHRFSLSLSCRGPAVLVPLGPWSDGVLARTSEWWRSWASRTKYTGPYREAVVRSALTLRLLVYPPSGAILAAPTTSLPERLGAEFNWDYRFSWLRDASLVAHALLGVGHADEARAFVGWLLHTTRLSRPALRVLYDVFGERPLAERILDHLAGHRSSRPVRVGNAAEQQLQLDLYGEVIDAAFQLWDQGSPIDRTTGRLLVDLGRYVVANWSRPDQGLWEPRGAPRHHVHSRVLCWVALDRLVRLADEAALRLSARQCRRFEEVRDEIRREVEERGWSELQGSYVDVLGGERVDASLLLLAWYGFHPADHPRLRGTHARIRETLGARGGLVHRNAGDQAQGQGAFGICGFWAVEDLARGGGTLAEASELFEQLLAFQNDVGLFAEQVDPADGSALGNFPQAFTHVGLISAALALQERARREGLAARPVRAGSGHGLG